MSPMLRSVAAAGVAGIQRKIDPSSIAPIDFFSIQPAVKQKFAKIVNAKAKQIALVPSVSYGLAAAFNNISGEPGQEVITVGDEFPSDYFAAKRWAEINQCDLTVIRNAAATKERGRLWNQRLLEAISSRTAIVNISSVHWMDGTRYDLVAIGARCKEVGAKLIVDGTQSVGAMPIDVQATNIHALICGAYKWLMGPYSMAIAYYHEDFNEGRPLEESWANRENAEEFSKLADYSSKYTEGAGRYNVGQSSNFILLPMLNEALRQILEWQPAEIQKYCGQLTEPLVDFAMQHDWEIDEVEYRCNHLFGLKLPATSSIEALVYELKQKKIIVSVRGTSVRVAPNVYNDEADIAALLGVLGKHVL